MSLYASCPCGIPEGSNEAHLRTDCPLYGLPQKGPAMTDTNNTDGAALLPVTQSDREAAAKLVGEAGCCACLTVAAEAFARHRIATQEDAERSGVSSIPLCIRSRPLGFVPGKPSPTPQRQEYDGEAVLKRAYEQGYDDGVEDALTHGDTPHKDSRTEGWVNFRAALAHPAQARDEMREALERLSKLTPHSANAATAEDFAATVHAIADSALARQALGGK